MLSHGLPAGQVELQIMATPGKIPLGESCPTVKIIISRYCPFKNIVHFAEILRVGTGVLCSGKPTVTEDQT